MLRLLLKQIKVIIFIIKNSQKPKKINENFYKNNYLHKIENSRVFRYLSNFIGEFLQKNQNFRYFNLYIIIYQLKTGSENTKRNYFTYL